MEKGTISDVERRIDRLFKDLGIDPEAKHTIRDVCQKADVDQAQVLKWIEEGKVDIRWTGRHRADARFTDEMVQRIKQLAKDT